VDANWGKDDDAVLTALETVRRDDPEYRAADVRDKLYVVRLGRADNQIKDGNPDGAVEELKRAVEVDPNRPEAKQRLEALTPTPVPPTATPRPVVVPQQQAPVQRPPVQQAPAQQAPAQAAPAPAAPAQQAPAPAPRATRAPPASGNPLE
jgi:hypothetical protein